MIFNRVKKLACITLLKMTLLLLPMGSAIGECPVAMRRILVRPELPRLPEALDGANLRITFDDRIGSFRFEWRDDAGKEFNLVKPLGCMIDVVIACIATPVGEDIVYNYTFTNLASSGRKLHAVRIEIPGDATCSEPRSRGWRGRTNILDNRLRWIWTGGGTEMEPGGVPIGESMSDFVFASHGLPTVVSCTASGSVPLLFVPEDAPSEVYFFPDLGLNGDRVAGQTIGPGLVFQSDKDGRASLLKRMEEDLRKARAEGWISCDETLTKLMGLVATIQSAVQMNANDRLKTAVDALCLQVEQEYNAKPRTVTEEVVSIIAVSGNWLMGQVSL